MPRKTGTQKRKARKQTSVQEGQDPVEKKLGELRSEVWAISIRNHEGVEDRVDFVRGLLRTNVG